MPDHSDNGPVANRRIARIGANRLHQFLRSSNLRRNNWCGSGLILSVVTLSGMYSVSAAATDLGSEITLTTDYVFRGVSQTMSSPALQGSVDFSHENGLFAYLWASNVDYVPSGAPDDGAHVEVDLLLGYDHAISDRVTATASWVRYAYPGMHEDMRYDFSEWAGAVTVDDRHRVALAYSPDAFGSGGSSLYYSASTVFELPANLELSVELGRYDLRNSYREDYGHASVSVAGGFERLSWVLGYHATSDDAGKIFNESTVAPAFVLSLSASF